MRLNLYSSLLFICVLPSFASADNAYVSKVTTEPTTIASFTGSEQVIGQATFPYVERIANTSKMWVLGARDAVNEADELPKPAFHAIKKQIIKPHAKSVIKPVQRVNEDCALCEAERNLLLGKIHKKTTQQVATQEEMN